MSFYYSLVASRQSPNVVSLGEFIENLQRKPRYIRVAILWTVVGIFMLGLFVFWINTLDLGMAKPQLQQQKEAMSGEKSLSEIKKEIPSLWQSLKAGAGDLFEMVNKESESGNAVQEPGSQREADEAPSMLP